MRIGVGIQNKALEAMAMGRPVVATPLAGRALRGATRVGALCVAETTEAFVDACIALLENTDETLCRGRAARRYVEENHRWAHAADRFIDIYREIQKENS
jgi:glycosyltransferase involved in cell wall biosynthesis